MASRRRPRGKPLITFNGWDGQWWRRINVAKGVWDAATFVYLPAKWSIALAVGELIIDEVRGND